MKLLYILTSLIVLFYLTGCETRRLVDVYYDERGAKMEIYQDKYGNLFRRYYPETEDSYRYLGRRTIYDK